MSPVCLNKCHLRAAIRPRLIQRFYRKSSIEGLLTKIRRSASTQTHCKPFHHSGRTAARCRTGNRRCHTVPATEPNGADVEIALRCRCGTEIRTAGEVPSIRHAPAARLEDPRSGGG